MKQCSVVKGRRIRDGVYNSPFLFPSQHFFLNFFEFDFTRIFTRIFKGSSEKIAYVFVLNNHEIFYLALEI